MAIDKELYRKTYAQYQQWSDARLLERAKMANKLSSVEAFRQYVDLVEFVWKLSPKPEVWQREEKLKALDRYYAQIQKLEAWRRTHRKAA